MNSTVSLDGAPNFRTLAGIRTADGRMIRAGRLFRSEVLSELSEDDIRRARTIDIGLVCDLRNRRERATHSNRWPEAEQVHTVLRKDGAGIRTAPRTAWEAQLLEEHFDEEQARQYMLEAYRCMPRELAGHIFAMVEYWGRPGSSGILVHCMAGKDRTGFVCAMILSLLGVPVDTILANYLASAQRLIQSNRMHALLSRSFGAEIPPRAQRAAHAIGTVRVEYLEAAFGEIVREHGSIDGYLATVAGPDGVRIAQQQLLTPL